MNKVFFDVGLSLDGYLAGPNRRPGNPLGDGAIAIHEWMFATATFQQTHGAIPGTRGGGQRGADDDLVRAVVERAGAHVLGRRMFDEGEVGWGEEAPFHAPVFVLTHAPREPWVRKGGTTFHFVTGGFAEALTRAKAAAKGKDVRIGGGADTIRQALRAGAIDDFTLHVAPLLLGSVAGQGGLRLFDDLGDLRLLAEPTGASHSAKATHLHFRVRSKG